MVTYIRTKKVRFLSEPPTEILTEVAGFMGARGLMHRTSLGENSGMYFTFSYPDKWSFWMEGTYIPLDIIFIDKNNKVVDIIQGEPLSRRELVPKEECMHVVETNKGWAAKNNIVVGTEVVFEETSYVETSKLE